MNGLNYIPLIIERLKETNPDKIILFGSYADGQQREGSDLDILVVTGDNIIPENFSERTKIFLRISNAISDIKSRFPIDLIVHTRPMHSRFIKENSLFARQLLSQGKVLYEKSN